MDRRCGPFSRIPLFANFNHAKVPTAFITGLTVQDSSHLTEMLLSKGYEVHGLLRGPESLATDNLWHLVNDPATFGRRLFQQLIRIYRTAFGECRSGPLSTTTFWRPAEYIRAQTCGGGLFACRLGMDSSRRLRTRLVQPVEEAAPCGNPAKAASELGWRNTLDFPNRVSKLVNSCLDANA
jgi:hypothetical protein